MSKDIPFFFCRYDLTINEEPLSGKEQHDILDDLKGKMAPHRKANPTAHDEDTFVMMSQLKIIEGENVLTWHVARQLGMREKVVYDKVNDKLMEHAVETDEVIHTKFISIPSRCIFAVDARVSATTLGGKSAISRFKSVISSIRGGRVIVEPRGRPEDVRRALQTWDLDKFSFHVRPSNPHPGKLGEKIEELLKPDNIGELQAVAKPATNKDMHDSEKGLIGGATELSEMGYGHFTFVGRTQEGRKGTYSKPKFDQSRDHTLQQQAQPRDLKIYLPEQGTVEDEEIETVRALVAFDGKE